MNDKKIVIYDTTLRDGTQSEDVNFTVIDKLRIAERLIDFGIDFIEGGWPGSNPRDMEFFNSLSSSKINLDKVTAFGSTRRAKKTCEEDEVIMALLEAGVPNITIFGKTWDLHVKQGLRISLDNNLELIHDSISFLKNRVDRVFYDAEHFFDGYKANRDYAIKTLLTARDAGADAVILCETNGGAMPDEITAIVADVKNELGDYAFGIHAHNDCGLAVANSLLAVRGGATHVQGTINGFGERTGNANLCSIMPSLQLKYGYDCVPQESMSKLKDLSGYVNELGNLVHNKRQPYVGNSAFAHKGGVHVSAILKNSKMYEHIDPELVGNKQRVLLSDLSGKSNLIYKAEELGIDVSSDDSTITKMLKQLKELENRGFEFEGAEASFELLLRKATNNLPDFFKLLSYRVINESNEVNTLPSTEATVMLSVNDVIEHTAATGNGPVNALDNALRKALVGFYPELTSMTLVDYKVRILSSHDGTSATTRVLIVTKDYDSTWGTVGVGDNIVEASYQALIDSILYKLIKSNVN